MLNNCEKIIVFFLLASCLVCPAAAEESFPLARKLINSQGCKACHRIDQEGGNYAQPLDKIGRHRSREQLRKLLQKGIAEHHDRYMPSYPHLEKIEIEALVDYLESYR